MEHLSRKQGQSQTLILASASPRRQALLKRLVPNFLVRVAQVDERQIEEKYLASLRRAVEGVGIQLDPSPYLDLGPLVGRLAEAKGRAVFSDLSDEAQESTVVLSADTMVVLDGEILHKGETIEQSTAYLSKLNGRVHRVLTAQSILTKGKLETRLSETLVRFQHCPRSVYEAYVAEAKPFDKAGAYGLQDEACQFVDGVQGRLSSVIGLDLHECKGLLERAGLRCQPYSELTFQFDLPYKKALTELMSTSFNGQE